MSSPLGKYGEIAAAIVAVGLVGAAVLAHIVTPLLMAIGVAIAPDAVDTTWIDNAALLAVGVVLGQRSATNGAAKVAQAAHLRLDSIGAPPSGKA